MTEIALETDKTAVAKQLLPSPTLQHRNHIFLCHVCVQQNSTLPSISQTSVGFHDAFDFQANVLAKCLRSEGPESVKSSLKYKHVHPSQLVNWSQNFMLGARTSNQCCLTQLHTNTTSRQSKKKIPSNEPKINTTTKTTPPDLIILLRLV